MIYKGKTHTVGDHIDTDAIIPARFLVTADTAELGKNCFEGLEEGWVKRVTKGDILVAGENFGCGSSREHAPLAIIGAGIPVVLAKSYARIFYRNAFNMGLMLLELGDDIARIKEGDELEIDVAAGKIKNLSSGETIGFNPVPQFMMDMLSGGGLVEYVKRKVAQ
jgi:3-isopropylmalate/(R)-2-methylmalate dehydratase small subunit